MNKEFKQTANIKKALEFAQSNGYEVQDISYNGFIRIEKDICQDEYKIKVEIHANDKRVPVVYLFSKEADFGHIMAETKYTYKMTTYHHKFNKKWYDLQNTDNTLNYIQELETLLIEDEKRINDYLNEKNIRTLPA